MSRMSEMAARLGCSSSLVPGRTFTSRPATDARRLIWRIVSELALGIAMIAVVAPVWSRMSTRSRVVPIIGTPRIRRWRLVGSSSTRPTGRHCVASSLHIEWISCRPPSPAPITREGSVPRSVL